MDLSALHTIVKTPELDVVRVASVKNNQVLLVQESDDPNWKLPGGKIHANETILQAFQREVAEELGIVLDEPDILNYHVTNIPNSENLRHIFLVREINEQELLPTPEVAEARYFPLDSLPETKFKQHISSAVALVSTD